VISSQIREIEKRAYYHNFYIDSNQILHSDKGNQMPFVGGPHTRITNPRWPTTAILENEKSPYLCHGSSAYDEIRHDDTVRPSSTFRPLKN